MTIHIMLEEGRKEGNFRDSVFSHQNYDLTKGNQHHVIRGEVRKFRDGVFSHRTMFKE
jgi:hypothetical protein